MSEKLEVVIKGEIHASRGDFQEERELLVEGVDHLILEKSEDLARNPRLRNYWFLILMALLEHGFMRRVYTDTSVLEDIAYGQDADVEYTRETNMEILTNATKFGRILAFSTLIILVAFAATSIFVGAHFLGFLFVIMAVIFPPYILREDENRGSEDTRDHRTAEKIETAAQEGGRIVAIVGGNHADDVSKNLSKWVDPTTKGPKYQWYSPYFLRDIIISLWNLWPIFIVGIWLYLT